MKNLKYFPFERNRYFYGKLLTVADFEAEQKYFNDKRRLINRLLFGSGIVCGLNTVKVDDNSISVEMGVALDYAGREIVLENPVIKRLSTVEGFDANSTSNKLFLCIEYDEKEKDPVHSISNTSAHSEESLEHNKIKESFRLFLTEQEPDPSAITLAHLNQNIQTVYDDHGIRIKQITPKYINPLNEMDIEVIVEKLQSGSLSFSYVLNTPYFTSDDGQSCLKVIFSDKDKEDQQEFHLKFKVKAGNLKNIKAQLTVDPESFNLSLTDRKINTFNQFESHIEIIDSSIKDAIMKKYFAMSMDDLLKSTSQHQIYLAEITVLNVGKTYIIESIKNNPFNQNIINSQLSEILNNQNMAEKEFLDKNNAAEISHSSQTPNTASPASRLSSEGSFATGIVEIPIGLNPKYNQKFFSEEIIHGLGRGPVFVDLGVECTEDPNNILNMGHQVIFGDQQIFSKSQYEPLGPLFSTAVITYADKGTFVIGMKLLGQTEASAVKVRWRAYKDPSDHTMNLPEVDPNKNIFIEPDTITLSPRETGHFKVVYNGQSVSSFNWSVVEPDGGKIDSNGVYTAPSKEGVYEIKVASTDGSLKASAFAIVKEK